MFKHVLGTFFSQDACGKSSDVMYVHQRACRGPNCLSDRYLASSLFLLGQSLTGQLRSRVRECSNIYKSKLNI